MKTFGKPIHDRPHGWLAASLFLALCGPLSAADLDLEVIGSWPLLPRGPALAVAVSGSYAYVTTGGAGLQVIDISDPVNPKRVNWHDDSGTAYDLAVSGNYAYVADLDAGLQVFDIRNPSVPVEVSRFNTNGSVYAVAVSAVAVSDNYAYVADSWLEGTSSLAALQVIDVSDRSNPQRVGSLEGAFGRLAISGHYAYVGAYEAGLQVIDVSDPSNPQRVGSLEAGWSPQDVAVSGQYAYVAGSWREGTNHGYGLQVIDISNPVNPRRVGSLEGASGSLALAGNYAYVAVEGWRDGTNLHPTSLHVIDISSPASPQRVGSLGLEGAFSSLAVVGNYAYVAEGGWDVGAGEPPGGLRIIDISNPALPQRVGSYDTDGDPASDLVVSGHHAYVADGCYGLQVIDISNPANPRRLGGYDTSGQAQALALSGDYAYVADGDSGLQVIDISNPANPRRVGGCDTSGYAEGVAVSSNYAYLAEGAWSDGTTRHSGGLRVINVSDAANPQQLGSYDTSGDARDVVVSGHYAYLAEDSWYEGTEWHSGSLRVIDVSDPANPQQVAAVADTSFPTAIAVSDDYAYVADRGFGLQVIDVSSPTNPRAVGGCRTRWNASDVAVRGRYAYVVSVLTLMRGLGCLEVIDVSDPANPRPVAGTSTVGGAGTEVAVAVSDSYVYCLSSSAGAAGNRPSDLLQVIDIKPANPQRVGNCETGGYATEATISGNYAYVLFQQGLDIIDVSNPVNPHRVGRLDGLDGNGRLAVSGAFAYFAGLWGGQDGLHVIDISNPTHPHVLGLTIAHIVLLVSGRDTVATSP